MQAVPGLSAGFQAASSMFSGMSQANALRGAAAVDNENARLSELQGALDVTAIHRRGRAVQGEAIAALAGNGTGSTGGSAADLIYQNSLDIEFAALNAKYSAATEARGYRMKAVEERSAAKNAIFGGILGAGAAAVTGIQGAYNTQREDAAYQSRSDAYFPGGQQFPLPDMAVDLPSAEPVATLPGGF